MEGQDHCVKLGPYLAPEPAPRWFQTRRLTRHGFLSSRWGLKDHRPPFRSSMLSQSTRGIIGGRSVPHAPTASSLGSGAGLSDETRATLDCNFSVLRHEILDVGSSVRRLEKTADGISQQVRAGIAEQLERVLDAQKTNLERQHSLELEKLHRDRVQDQRRLAEVQEELELANMRAAAAAQDLSEALEEIGARDSGPEINAARESGKTDKDIRDAFVALRESVLDFARSSALQLGQLPETNPPVDVLFEPRSWNRASPRQRRRRVVARVFHLLFRRILRPGLRIFGLHAFLKCDQHHAISASEAHLRALERELEAQGVDGETLVTWIATTIDTTTPLRDIPRNIECITREIFDALSPLIRFTFSRNADKVRTQIAAICEDAVRLKLAMRRAPGGYKIEVPSRDAKRWGEPGCDEEVRAFMPPAWLRVIDHEPIPTNESKPATAAEKQPRGDIACIVFGALTRSDKTADGGRKKVVMEKGWVISRGVDGKLKRKAPTLVDQEGQARKRPAPPNRGIFPAHLARVKAIMGEQ